MFVLKQQWKYNRPSAAVCFHITVDFHWSQLTIWPSHIYGVYAVWRFIADRENLVTVSRLTLRISRDLRRCTTPNSVCWKPHHKLESFLSCDKIRDLRSARFVRRVRNFWLPLLWFSSADFINFLALNRCWYLLFAAPFIWSRAWGIMRRSVLYRNDLKGWFVAIDSCDADKTVFLTRKSKIRFKDSSFGPAIFSSIF